MNWDLPREPKRSSKAGLRPPQSESVCFPLLYLSLHLNLSCPYLVTTAFFTDRNPGVSSR